MTKEDSPEVQDEGWSGVETVPVETKEVE